MLFNCFNCGKKVSSKKESCVYCKGDNSLLISELNKTREKNPLTTLSSVKEKHAGTFLSLLLGRSK